MVCNKGFSTSSSLNTHKRIHSGEKPHQCLVCGKKFTASSNLYYHRMTHIKVSNFVFMPLRIFRAEHLFYENSIFVKIEFIYKFILYKLFIYIFVCASACVRARACSYIHELYTNCNSLFVYFKSCLQGADKKRPVASIPSVNQDNPR